jgi:hypothetical protein
MAVGAATLMAGAAQAQVWSDDMESYPLGQLDGQGRWKGWDSNNTLFSNVVNSQASGGAQSAEVAVGADTICDYDLLPPIDMSSGGFSVTQKILCPTGSVGKTYYIIMNDYNDFGPYEWSVQIGFNMDAGMVECDCGTNGTVTAPINFGAWAEVQCDFDLDGDNVDIYYDGSFLASYPPSMGVFGTDSYASLQIDALDLYPDGPGFPNTSPVYFDDFNIDPAGPQDIGTPFCFGDGTGTTCPCGNSGGAGEGCGNSTGSGGGLAATGDTTAGGNQSYNASNLIAGQPALLFSGNNAINGGLGITFGDGLRCAGQGVQRHGVRVPDSNGDASWGSPLPNTNWVAGDTKHFQGWYRDPSGSPCGNGFNLTNGHTITFN